MFVREEDKSRLTGPRPAPDGALNEEAAGGAGGFDRMLEMCARRYAAASSSPAFGSPISIGLLTGSALHSNQPPSYTAIRGQSMRRA